MKGETQIEVYQVIWGTSTSDLSDKIKKELKYGWKLQGGVSSAPHETYKDILIQAMTKTI